ncbi:hypothetical protein [Myxococcus landrumensis]|uniref:Transposase (putative) YhgA-like domain-containing protein n=1 Tax=Myxococcus landrumensis TaxID=2813577 RepID=A0ABX7N0B1_9BACT|nr:hypothetical protein [Myxococcus landrumus]QSQ12149.1 hypothetical protein JY572_27765 [Myxococcus landrumus]
MGSIFDLVLRRLVQAHPAHLLRLLFGSDAPTFVRAADTSLPQSERRADAVLVVETSSERFVLEVELQAQSDPHFMRRLLDYTVRVHLREGLPVLPVVVLVVPEAEGVRPPYVMRCRGQPVLTLDFLVVRLWEVDFTQPALQSATGLLPLSVLDARAGPERADWAEARIREAKELSADEQMDLLVVLGTLTSRRFGIQRLTPSLRNIMTESAFWDELIAFARTRFHAQALMTFAATRGLTVPREAEEHLIAKGESALKQIHTLAFTHPDAAQEALFEALLSGPPDDSSTPQ